MQNFRIHRENKMKNSIRALNLKTAVRQPDAIVFIFEIMLSNHYQTDILNDFTGNGFFPCQGTLIFVFHLL